jgi:superfamily II DNA or RNA helicase/predicted house-cleaning noncanonical NTP pyrophosphatase (MazG superfamily)/HKD family nuclease
MKDYSDFSTLVHRKLVRDRIPELIRSQGKSPETRQLDDQEFRQAVAMKLLEEAYELFRACKAESEQDVLKESADVLEITLTALNFFGFNLDDLIAERQKRLEERGGFSERVFLDGVGVSPSTEIPWRGIPGLVFTPAETHELIKIIKSELMRSRSVCIASAFYSPGIMNLLLRDFTTFVGNGRSLRVLLSTMGNVNRPEYLTHLQQVVPYVQVKVFHPPDLPFDQAPPNFHLKVYLFEHHDGNGAFVIGSSNFTEAGFSRNIEWNYFSSGEINLPFEDLSTFEKALEIYDHYWRDSSVDVTDKFLSAYRKRFALSAPKHPITEEEDSDSSSSVLFDAQSDYIAVNVERIKPNSAQEEALNQLADFRMLGITKAAIIAATGVGKTYLAAFDFKQSRSRKVLFIAHRENILIAARESFRRVMGNASLGSVLGGGKSWVNKDGSIFAMIQTLSRDEVLNKFSPDAFEYVVVDEFHHGEAASYRKVIDYFRPAFFLGLTATPERMDGRDVLALCDYNIAFEVRLMEAVDRGWLIPFQYYAIYDETDYSQITWKGTHYDELELSSALENDTRTSIIASNLKKFLPSGSKTKALAFCSSVSHAHYTAKMLSKVHGIPAVSLTGEDSENQRAHAISRLRNQRDPLQVICTVDLFNEGIDIPDLTHVLLIRPTQSFTVFLQQLGRGLRLSEGKEFLVVIDFVGNFRKAHVAPMALNGYNSTEQYVADLRNNGREISQLPKGCFLDADLEVSRIWDDEIRKIIKGELSKEEQLKALYLEIKEDLDNSSPSLLDFIGNTHGVDPYIFIRHFGGWLRAKLYCEGKLDKEEEALLGTPAEDFLKHIEADLKPSKSYKMVVLLSILTLPGTTWKVKEIARRFLDYFLLHSDKIQDYEELARHPKPDQFPLSKVISKLNSMPLHFLSNKETDFFLLNKRTSEFKLRPQLARFWEGALFRSMIKERVEFSLVRYFDRTKVKNDIPPG